MIELSFDQVKSIVDDLIQENGEDFVYVNPEGLTADDDRAANCYYVHGDKPGCIAGQVLHRAGVPLEILKDWDYPGGEDYGKSAVAVLDGLNIMRDKKTQAYLSNLQIEQDSGSSWSNANKTAMRLTANIVD